MTELAVVFSAHEVARIMGITYRQLDYWTRRGYIAPSIQAASGSGSQRRFSPQDLEKIFVISQLAKLGIPPGVTLGLYQRSQRDEHELTLESQDGVKIVLSLLQIETAIWQT